MAQHSSFADLLCQAFATDMLGLHSKLGFKVEELKTKSGVKPVQGSSIPLILPNDLKYNPSTGRVVKVHCVRRESLKVVPEALALLEGIEEPVSVLAISGPCRTGKSYILSRLLGTPDAFELGHRMDPQTFGIWMGTKVLRGKDFTIVLLDTEGIDSAGASADQDASILVLTILLSSHLIYNSLNVPYKGDLEKMQCFIKLAKGIIVNKAERTQMSAFREFFPDFLWLLRDVSPKLTDHNGVEIDPSEYLKTRVLGRGDNEDDFDESTSDKVGRAILTFFSSVECAILERPSEKVEVMNNIAQYTESLDPRFNKGVNELTERLLLKSRAKRGYDKGSTVSGVALSIMTKQYVEAVNDPNSIPAMDNTWQNTVELMKNRAIEEAVMEYNQQMQAQIARATNNGRVPLEENTGIERIRDPDQVALMDLHNEVLHDVTEMLLERVRNFGISSGDVANENKVLVDQMQKRLVQREERTVDYVAADGTARKQKGSVVTGGELLHYIQQNKELSKLFCQTLFARLFDPIRKHSESPPPDFDLQALIEERDRARQQYVEQARGPEKWVVLLEMSKDYKKLKDTFVKIKRYQQKFLQEKQKAEEAQLQVMELQRQLENQQEAMKNLVIEQQMEKTKREMLERENEFLRSTLRKEPVQLVKESDTLLGMSAGASAFGAYSRTVDVEESFETVVALVSSKWDNLAEKLGFSWNEIKGLRTSEPNDDRRCKEMLHRWRNRKGSEATLWVLRQALIDIDERLTAESL